MHRALCSGIPQIDGCWSESETESENENESLTSNADSTNIDMRFMNDNMCTRFLLTNARSLEPKTDSMIQAFDSLNLHFAGISETWYKGGGALADHLIDVEGASGIKILHQSRDGRLKTRGGGVAFAFDTSTCNFKRRQLKNVPKGLELICAVGRVEKISKRIAVFVAYVPPSMRAGQFKEFGEALAAEVAAVKTTYKSPGIIVMGDFNHRDVLPFLEEVEHMTTIGTGPTRGNNVLDIVYTNMGENTVKSRVLPPLDDKQGIPSDHNCVFVATRIPDRPSYTWEVKLKRTRTKQREEAFACAMKATDWSGILMSRDANQMTRTLEKVIDDLTNAHLPLARVRKRSNESPWITRHIRRLWKKKIREYKKNGKSDRWKQIDNDLQDRITNARKTFVELMLEEGNSGKSFYAATRKLSAAKCNQPWAVSDIFPGTPPEQVGKNVLDYFGKIASATDHTIPHRQPVPGGLPPFDVDRTTDLLKEVKKSDSMVKGDPLPNLVRGYPEAFAEPVSAIFNAVNDTGCWPDTWKTEHLTIIPQNPNPTDLSECRNISCTSIFSKILEGEVLKQLRRELEPDPDQYGGVPKCGTEHMIIELWDL